jgi:hypothetical protein
MAIETLCGRRGHTGIAYPLHEWHGQSANNLSDAGPEAGQEERKPGLRAGEMCSINDKTAKGKEASV